VEENLPIAGLSERSIMEDDPSLRELLAAQEAEGALPVDDSIPAAPAKGPRVPDFRGKSVRNVVELASAEGIAVTIQGSGVARAQVPAAGRPMNRGEKIRVVFAR
jgi:cell division protein FtsI (penicillin-binding protein 3)